ncbi:MAG TPA: acyl-CoA dehydrogenase family protein [Polyangiaceae bacterium]|nr:acyl-CoA dehydrogenase family protein [Polyangiaceae bacterium]
MDLRFSEAEEAFREEARAWLAANVPDAPLPSGDTREGFAEHLKWERKLHDAGWAAVAWPKRYGGRDATLMQWLVFEEEYWRAGAPNRVTQNGVFLLAPSLFAFGTEEQKDRLLPDIAAARTLWAQGWSEPGAGSDLAALQSRAERVPGGFRLYGQKTWCTRGAFCDAIFGPFRTDPAAAPHKGITYFLVPLKAEGGSVRGTGRLDGDEGFADVFLDGVFVPDRDVLGPVNEGWKVAMGTTSSERGLSLRSPGRFMASAARLIDLYRRYHASADPTLRDRVVRAFIDAEAYRWFTFEVATQMAEGKALGPEASASKIFWSEMDLALHETALALLGPQAELESGASDAADGGSWMKGYQFALAGPIYAGTNEIQRNVVAERVLGLPRK